MKPSTSSGPRRRYGFVALTLMILISMAACNLPFAKATPTATEAPPPTALPTVAKQSLPPAVVEISPVPDSTIPVKGDVAISFNQDMERSSVEGALQVEPASGGRFEWQDDRNVTFTPDQPFAPGTKVRLTLKETALAANGLALPEPLSFDFQAAETLRLSQRLPEGQEIDPTSAVVAAFNQPVVPLGADTADLPAAFTLEPAADGNGEWLNTSTYIFYPRVALEGGKTYTVRVNSGLQGTGGTTFETGEGLDWTFQTAAPRILEISPAGDLPVPLDQKFTIRFNQPMDVTQTAAALAFTGSGGMPVAGALEWNETGSELTFSPDELLPRNTAHFITLDAAAAGAGGTPLENPQQAAFVTVPELDYLSSQFDESPTLQTFMGYASFSLTFSAPILQKQAYEQIVSISPEVSGFSVWAYDDYLNAGGYFQPSTTYQLNISTGLVDPWGGALANPVSLTFTTAPFDPAIVVPMTRVGSEAILLMPWEQSIQAQVNNVSQINARRAVLTVEDFIMGIGSLDMVDTFYPDATWSQAVGGVRDQIQTVNLRVSPEGGALDSGLYALGYSSPAISEPYQNARLYAVVSQVQLTVKYSADQVFVWAASLTDQTPVPDLPLKVYDLTAQVLAQAVTGADGTAVMDLPAGQDPYSNLYVVAGEPGDEQFGLTSTGMTYGLSPWQMGVDSDYSAPYLRAYLYTDRPIYRPGQTLYLRGALRLPDNGRYLLPSEMENPLEHIDLQISGYTADGAEAGWTQELSLPVSDYGTFTSGIELPAGLPAGYYSIHAINLEGWQSIGFQVAEYRKPEIEVTAAFKNPETSAGLPLEFTAQADYYFGTPAANLPVAWSLYEQQEVFYLPGYRVGKATWDWRSFESSYITGGSGMTDGQGSFNLTLTEADILGQIDAEEIIRLVLEVTVMDESGLPVSNRAEVLRHPASFYIGVRSDAWIGAAEAEMGFDLLTVDWQKKSSPNHALSASFLKVSWVEGEVDIDTGESTYERVASLVSSTDLTSDASGKARVTFTPPEPGVYLLQVRGETAVTEYTLWVAGSGVAQWPRLPDDGLELRSDAETYQPGDTATIQIPNPFDEPALALITVERGKVMRSEVVQMDEAVLAYPLLLEEEDAPNVYLSVFLISAQAGEMPHFRYGVLNISVDRSELLLKVQLTPKPDQTTPGSEVVYELEVKDASGQPVQGEFSLAVVDKALLALSDPNSQAIEDAYYGLQPLGVQTSSALAVYARRIERAPVQLGRGGGGGDGAPLATSVREDFRDTAYWSGTVITDAQGLAELRIAMPDNLTTWVAEVRGLDLDQRVGSATAEVVVSKELLVRPVTPRFAVVGDHMELAAIVHNNSDRALNVQVSLQAGGFVLDDDGLQTQSLDLPVGGQTRVNWWGSVEAVDELDLVFSAQAGALSDSARPTWGRLPVLRYAAPQSFATAGMLATAGQRLELVSLPTSYQPTGGQLDLELTPSLTAVILSELEALDAYEYDYTEAILSRLLPNIETYRILKTAGISAPELEERLALSIQDGLERLERMQNEEGGWGWFQGEPSNLWNTAYIVFGLSRAKQAGLMVSQDRLDRARDYLQDNLLIPNEKSMDEDIHDAVFTMYALQQSGSEVDAASLWPFYERMNPSSSAMLALMLQAVEPGGEKVRTLVNDLQAGAVRSATGAFWEEPASDGFTYRTANYDTAVVIYALAQLDPASIVLSDAVRYLAAHRKAARGWGSTYETAWVLLGLGEYMRGTGDLRPSYDFTAALNGEQIASGVASGAASVPPVQTRVALSSLLPDEPNGLVISRGEGSGALYYRAYLQADRPIEEAVPVNRGLSIAREYFMLDEDCKMPDCTSITSVSLADENPQVLARVTVTLPHDQYYLVIEDYIPAGMEVVDISLKTTEQGDDGLQPYTADSPFARGWGWWWFHGPRIYNDRVHWSAQYLSAGTYELTYRMIPVTPGEFRTLPAHAWQYYFPEVEGSSAGSIFSVTP